MNKGYVGELIGSPQNNLLSEVRNESGVVYRQRIQAASGDTIDGDCTCPVAYNCKHVAAALISWAGMNGSVLRDKPQISHRMLTWIARTNELALDGDQTNAKSDEERPEDYPPKTKERLLYVLERSGGGLSVSIWKGRVNAQGTGLNVSMQRYNILQNLRSSIPKFIRPIDLVLVSELAQAKLIVGQYSYGSYTDIPEVLRHSPTVGTDLIERICKTERCFSNNDISSKLVWSEENRPVDLTWNVGASGSQRLGFAAGEVVQVGADMIWIDANAGKLGCFEGQVSPEIVRLVEQSPELNPDDLPVIVEALPTHLGVLPLPKPVQVKQVTRAPQTRVAKLKLDVAKTCSAGWYRKPVSTLPTLTLLFDYEGIDVAFGDFVSPQFVSGDEVITLKRDNEWEENCYLRLVDTGAIPPFEGDFTPSDKMLDADLVFPAAPSHDAMRFTFDILPQLRSEGWQITENSKWPYRLSAAKAQLSVSTQAEPGEGFQGHDWFSFGFQVKISAKNHDIAPMIAAFLEQIAVNYDPQALPDLDSFTKDMDRHPVYVDLGKEGYTQVSLAPIAGVLHLFLRQEAERHRLHPTDAPLVAAVHDALNGSDVCFADEAGILPLARALQALSAQDDYTPPEGLKAKLRPYQAFGADWMERITEAGFGGVLADDMGLGKTLQTLTTLQARQGRGPSLLVAPTSLLHNWQNQAAQFTPELRLLTLHGLKRRELAGQIPDADLVITTYPLLSRDQDILSAQNWDLIIVDEAQTLKNPASQMAKALRLIPGSGRLALTGTPVENSLQDLWTLFDWVVPGLLGNRKTFVSVFRTPIEKHADAQAQARLNRRIRPFLLRRTKEEVASELPPRTEITHYIELPKPQQALYETVRASMDERVREAVQARGLNGAQITILDALLKLRQVCCDPGLVKSEAARSVTDSAKRARLLELLIETTAEHRRVLVFSQFTTMLDLIATDLDELGIPYVMLTGQTKDRGAVLNAFQSGTVPVFLLSLKAGGVGLTLTEADTVFLYDPWWNPAVERQAMDRAHRIGQDKPVFVHRLVVKGTVEEKIMALQAKKQALADALLSSPEISTNTLFDEQTLKDLFAPLC
ncbi:DEAD/DEAH box helicase [Pseudovibrio sp. Tun.PSC04-5.I4]|uniref:DEAD/DEAH box helicase n=1 Tax=Pseudovibrio sp. Tun.PSC04-5.I4 TaxID=1798213 RepID=UPI0013563A38|nr:DEAD/DEAH box helicase [Pseudovibrio sp. Tun.PSC04-5.I4]